LKRFSLIALRETFRFALFDNVDVSAFIEGRRGLKPTHVRQSMIFSKMHHTHHNIHTHIHIHTYTHTYTYIHSHVFSVEPGGCWCNRSLPQCRCLVQQRQAPTPVRRIGSTRACCHQGWASSVQGSFHFAFTRGLEAIRGGG